MDGKALHGKFAINVLTGEPVCKTPLAEEAPRAVIDVSINGFIRRCEGAIVEVRGPTAQKTVQSRSPLRPSLPGISSVTLLVTAGPAPGIRTNSSCLLPLLSPAADRSAFLQAHCHETRADAEFLGERNDHPAERVGAGFSSTNGPDKPIGPHCHRNSIPISPDPRCNRARGDRAAPGTRP